MNFDMELGRIEFSNKTGNWHFFFESHKRYASSLNANGYWSIKDKINFTEASKFMNFVKACGFEVVGVDLPTLPTLNQVKELAEEFFPLSLEDMDRAIKIAILSRKQGERLHTLKKKRNKFKGMLSTEGIIY